MTPVETMQHVLTLNGPWMWWVVSASSLLAILWAIYTWGIRPYRKTFKDKDVVLELDTANNTLHIESGQDMRALALKLGCGRFDFRRQEYYEEKEKYQWGTPGHIDKLTGLITAPREGKFVRVSKKVSTGFTRITIDELDPIPYFYQHWANHPDVTCRNVEKSIAIIELRNRPARTLQRWVNAHRHELIPSEKAYRKKWDATCKHLLEECRQAPSVRKLKKPLEVFDYSTTPIIRYLAIGKEGEVCLKTLESNTAHELDFGQIQGEGSTLTVALPNGCKERFTLNKAQVSQLHQIRRRWQKYQTRANKHMGHVA